jgi:hypothetical protein
MILLIVTVFPDTVKMTKGVHDTEVDPAKSVAFMQMYPFILVKPVRVVNGCTTPDTRGTPLAFTVTSIVLNSNGRLSSTVKFLLNPITSLSMKGFRIPPRASTNSR